MESTITDKQQLELLERRVQELENRLAISEGKEKLRKYQKGAKQNIVELARKYATLKLYGRLLCPGGNVVTPSPSEVEKHLDRLRNEFLNAAEDLLFEDSQVGNG